jgi:fructose-specific phosphotransferase system IIC component
MTIKRIFNWLVGVPIAAVAIAFAVANRQWVTISFDPLNRVHPFATVDMPLWALFFCGIFVGIFAGWMVAWAANAKHRRAARAARIELIRTQQMHERYKHDHQPSTQIATRQDASL